MTLTRARPARGFGVLLLFAGLAAATCGRRTDNRPPVDVSWTLSPPAPAVGPAALTVTLRSASGGPLTAASVRLEAHMSHPGMSPVIVNAAERTPGVYEIPFAFTMAGDWVLLVAVTLADGSRTERRIPVANVQPPR